MWFNEYEVQDMETYIKDLNLSPEVKTVLSWCLGITKVSDLEGLNYLTFANRCPKAEKSLLSDSTDIVISNTSEETVKKAAELLKSGEETGIIVRLGESITDEERKSITNDTAEKVGEPLASLSAANRLYGLKIYKE